MVLTLRQLYYQHVARGLIENNQQSYNRLGALCNDARMMGLMDWDHLIDRTRNLVPYALWTGPEDAVTKAAERYHRDLWKSQHRRIEVWIEKDAAVSTIEGVCADNSVPYFSCRGYTSVSEMHSAAQRLRWHIEKGAAVTILHIGDHDPSGLDMTRDIQERLWRFITVDWRGLHGDNPFPAAAELEDEPEPDNSRRSEAAQRADEALRDLERAIGGLGGGLYTRGDIKRSMRSHIRARGGTISDDEPPFQIKRIALNIDQIEEYQPPPNYLKKSDARWVKYFEETGLEHSWELDALEPSVLAGLIQREVDAVRDQDKWDDAEFEMESERKTLKLVAAGWDRVAELVTKGTANG